MKKIYMTPSLKVANIVLPTLLADSNPTINVDPEGQEGQGGWGDAQSKKSSIFDM